MKCLVCSLFPISLSSSSRRLPVNSTRFFVVDVSGDFFRQAPESLLLAGVAPLCAKAIRAAHRSKGLI